MEKTFVTGIEIKKVRHLHDITIPLSSETRKHLILTGVNGSGKTSVLNALEAYLGALVPPSSVAGQLKLLEKTIDGQQDDFGTGIVAQFSSAETLAIKYEAGQFILAQYAANRISSVQISKNIEHVDLALSYPISANAGAYLVKYLVNLKTTQAFAQQKGDRQRAAEIEAWFQRFQEILRNIFDDPALKLDFDIETFAFHILQTGHEPFDFNQMSSGYAAIFAIINDLLIRMEAQKRYDLEGIVLIDEIDAHLHLELQKKILPILTNLFPNLQFIVTTHSPFILSSLENSVVFDLENRRIVENGLAKLPYEGIVEGYFGADRMSNEVAKRFYRYQELTAKESLTDEDYAEIDRLEVYLDEVPDFLAQEMSAEYHRLKLEFSNRSVG